MGMASCRRLLNGNCALIYCDIDVTLR
jgi:hypothetical protein